MLLNKIPCLDKGYIAQLDSSGTQKRLLEITMEFWKSADTKLVKDLATLSLVIKCPLFVQLHLSQFDIKLIPVPTQELEAYVPNVGEVGAQPATVGQEMVENMKATTDALLINQKAFQADGCERFSSQVLTPVSTYTTLIAHGSYNEWKRFCDQPKLPLAIKAYVKAVTQILNTDWRG